MAAPGVETPSGGWGAFLSIPETTARRHVQALVERGEVELEDKSRGRNPQWFSFYETDLELKAAGRLRCKVELGAMASARWNGSMRAVWIALGWHAREEGGWLSAWPSVARIGKVTGLGRRAVQSALSRVDEEGLLGRRTTRGASTYVLRTRSASVSREEAMQSALERRRRSGRGRRRALSGDESEADSQSAIPCTLTRHSVHPNPPNVAPVTRHSVHPELESRNMSIEHESRKCSRAAPASEIAGEFDQEFEGITGPKRPSGRTIDGKGKRSDPERNRRMAELAAQGLSAAQIRAKLCED